MCTPISDLYSTFFQPYRRNLFHYVWVLSQHCRILSDFWPSNYLLDPRGWLVFYPLMDTKVINKYEKKRTKSTLFVWRFKFSLILMVNNHFVWRINLTKNLLFVFLKISTTDYNKISLKTRFQCHRSSVRRSKIN